MPASQFNLARLRDGLKPFRLHWFSSLSSTSLHAAAMRRQGRLFAPAVILAGRQTAGRGRGANTWYSGPGSLTVTFALPVDPNLQPHQLPLIAGLATRNAVARLAGDNGIGLKWPNDLLYGGRKLGGLLGQRIDKADLIGLGLNINLDLRQAPRLLRDRITSLGRIARRPLDMTDVLIAVANELRHAVERSAERPFSDLLREYDSHHALLGRTVTVTMEDEPTPLIGRVMGLDHVGRLLIECNGKRVPVISGQVHGGY